MTISPQPSTRESRKTKKRAMSLDELRQIVTRVLGHRGIAVHRVGDLDRDDSLRLEAVGTGKMRDAKHIVYLEARPLHGRVDHHVVDALAEDVKTSGASAGLLFTPYHVDRGTAPDADVPLELVDGLGLARLVRHLDPGLAPTMATYRLAGSEPA